MWDDHESFSWMLADVNGMFNGKPPRELILILGAHVQMFLIFQRGRDDPTAGRYTKEKIDQIRRIHQKDPKGDMLGTEEGYLGVIVRRPVSIFGVLQTKERRCYDRVGGLRSQSFPWT